MYIKYWVNVTYTFEVAAILTKFLMCSTVYMVKFRAFIFDSVMYLYWDYPQGKNYASANSILKIMNF